MNDKWLISKIIWLTPLISLAISFLWASSFADSAYSSLRYAQNLAAGRGLAYDMLVGGMRLPLASPLLVLLLAAADLLGLASHQAALIISGLGWGATAVILYFVSSQIMKRPSTALLSAYLLAFNPIIMAALGTELSWTVGLTWLALWLSLQKRWRGQTAVLVLLLSTHFDTASILFVSLFWAAQPRENKWRHSLVLLLAGLGCGAAIWGWGLPFELPSPGWEPWLDYSQNLLNESEWYWFFVPFIGLGLLAKKPSALWRLLIWTAAAILLGSAAAGAAMAVAALFLTGLGVAWLGQWLEERNLVRLTHTQLAVSLTVILGLPLSMAQASSLWERYQMQPRARLQVQGEAAAWLRQNSQESATIVASPRFSYLADRPLLDDGRLSDPESIPSLLPHLLLHPPDYFITYRSLGWTYWTQTGWFQERFRLAQRFPSTYDAGAPLTIWKRSPSPLDQTNPTPISVRSEEDDIHLVSYQVGPRRLEPGDAVHVQLDWQSYQSPAPYFHTVVRLVSPYDRVAWAQRDVDMPRSLPSEWLEQDIVFPERFVLTTTTDIPVGAYLVTASLYRPREEGFVVLYQDGDTNTLDRVTLGYVVAPWDGEIEETAVPLEAIWGDQIKLLGCDCVATAVPGTTVNLRLYWEALRPPDDNYTVFVHLFDVNGQFVTGHDSPPFGGAYDTAAWLPGDIIPDDHPLTLPPDLPKGTYAVRAGLYQPENGTRLPVADAHGNLLPDQAMLLPSIRMFAQNN